MGGDNPLDASTVHPESYPLVQRILNDIKQDIRTVIGNSTLLKSLNPASYLNEKFGIPTITDILRELEKPGRDPRPEFTTATFREGVEQLSDLLPDMILEGVVTNVAAFGAFVDIGVHQDGLVHISALSSSFVKDPHTVVKAGQIVKVKVLEVDAKRRRIALTMRLTDPAPQTDARQRDMQRPQAMRVQPETENVKLAVQNRHDAIRNNGARHARTPLPNPAKSTSHSTKPSQNDGKIAGYLPKGEGTNERLRESGMSAMASAFAKLKR
jgi:uncharacterized protein